jgi:hypothetical protein
MQHTDGLNSLISSLLAIKTHAPTNQTAPPPSFSPPLCFDYTLDLLPPFWLFLERKKRKKNKNQIKSND